MFYSLILTLPFILILLALRSFRRTYAPRRPLKVPKTDERVIILGATSGIGREIAHVYAARGARVCVVGRREGNVNEVVEECRSLQKGVESRVLGIPGDFTNVDDMIRIRNLLEAEWQGIDTVLVAAGVSALQPVMALAGVEAQGKNFNPPQAAKAGIERAVEIASAATKGNYVGPLVTALTFIPLLSHTSSSPSILLVSSLAALIPAPTRAIYASTKSASLLLYQSLSIEHPSITFTHIIPSTVEGDFRASAVDGGVVREANPNVTGLKKDAVARRCVQAVDAGERAVFIPGSTRLGPFLYWTWPAFIERIARKKYKYEA